MTKNAEKSFRNISKLNWALTDIAEVSQSSNEQIMLGCLQRIADSTEIVSANFIQMMRELERQRGEIGRLMEKNKILNNEINALKSVNSRLKNKIQLITDKN